jgi:hypothetical protein
MPIACRCENSRLPNRSWLTASNRWAGVFVATALVLAAAFGVPVAAAGDAAARAATTASTAATAGAAAKAGPPAAPGQPADAAAAGAEKTGDPNRIEITSTASSWDNLSELFLGTTPAAPFGEGSMFVMRGELRNRSDRPVHHVVLRYELLDDKGKVLHDVEGFNRSAESMRPDEDGNVHAEQVRSIPAGGVDSYRMVFFHDEVPRFTSQRVRVSEVHTEAK